MRRKRSTPKLALFAAITLTAPITPAAAQDLLWVRQFGTATSDVVSRVAVDGAGNACIAGATGAIRRDVFHAKYDPAGALLFTRQFGTTEDDFAHDVAVDGADNAYIAGFTKGNLGGSNAGRHDVFLVKYDTAGTRLWTRQIGTGREDVATGVAVDGAGNAYITGETAGSLGGPNAGGYDAFLAKYDAAGNLLWTRQMGTEFNDRAQDVAVDGAGNAYIAGHTSGSLGGPYAGNGDAFLAKYDASGTLLWTRQTGTTGIDQAWGVAVDDVGNAYITGWTSGSLGGTNAGGHDTFLAKYDTAGALLWTRQAGTAGIDVAYGVAVDGAGNAYITGITHGNLGGTSAGSGDVFLASYDAAGNLLWTRQTGTEFNDVAYGVAVDGTGNAYIAGRTYGSFGGTNAGLSDAFLAKYSEALCYADCDQSTGPGVLDIFDFLCFQNSFVNSEPYACDCDTSTRPGVCDVFDFLCFQDAFVAGCP